MPDVSKLMECGMHVIAKRNLMALAREHGNCIQEVADWYAVASKVTWHNLSEVRQTYAYTDVVGDKTVFNIKGNDYRLIVHISYERGVIFIKDLLTHAEYDKGRWKAP